MGSRKSYYKVSIILLIIMIFSLLVGCDKSSTGSDDDGVNLQRSVEWPSLADSPWPMWGHDPQHSGRSIYEGPDTGILVDIFEINGQSSYSTISIGVNDTVYFCSSAEYDSSFNRRLCFIYKLDPDMNFIKKASIFSTKVNLFPEIYSSPLITNNGNVWIQSTDKNVYVFDRNLNLIFKKLLSSYNGYFGGNIDLQYNYIALSLDSLYKIDQNFNYIVESNKDNIEQISIFPDGTILKGKGVISIDNSFKYYKIEKIDGSNFLICRDSEDKELWRFKPDNLDVKLDPTVGQCINKFGDIICFGTYSFNTIVYSISHNGNLNWFLEIEDFIPGTYPITDSQGNIYIGSSYNGKIVCISKIGNIKWDVEFNGRKYYGSMAINSKKQLLLQDFVKGDLLCIE